MARILAVEDSMTVLNSLVQLLEREGYEVLTARDGLSAFAALQTSTPDLILLDIGLPGIGGIELCVAIRQTPTYKMTPIIMVTGSHKQVDARLAQQFGASAYITKPYVEAELLSKIESFLGTHAVTPSTTQVAQ
jgi:DNA-binding response OmpR family regulator